MKALSCPKCGAPLREPMPACPYCGIGLVADDPRDPQPGLVPRAPAQVQIPDGWFEYRDPWMGYSVVMPRGWDPISDKKKIYLIAEPTGFTRAIIWSYNLRSQSTAFDVASQVIAHLASVNPTFQAWRQENIASNSPRLTLRTRQARSGQVLEGSLNILVDGQRAIVSGYEAPEATISAQAPILAQVLSSFRPIPMMMRQNYTDQGYGAFLLQIPQGWVVEGTILLDMTNSTYLPRFTVSPDKRKLIAGTMPTYRWYYADSGGWGMLNFLKTMKFTPAVQYARDEPIKTLSKKLGGYKIERLDDRPDLAELIANNFSEWGMGGYDVTAAVLTSSYVGNGVQQKQRSTVITYRQKGSHTWMGEVNCIYNAPYNEYEIWQPIVMGILNTFNWNPVWQAQLAQQAQMAQMQAQQFMMNAQADMHNRLNQISQTLSQTSDIVASTYWSNQPIYDQMAQQRSNAMLDLQYVASQAGDVYQVPSGFERYWADGLGNIYGGDWTVDPDFQWTPLQPTGI